MSKVTKNSKLKNIKSLAGITTVEPFPNFLVLLLWCWWYGGGVQFRQQDGLLTHLVLGADVVQRLLGLSAERAVRLGVHDHAVAADLFFDGSERATRQNKRRRKARC